MQFVRFTRSPSGGNVGAQYYLICGALRYVPDRTLVVFTFQWTSLLTLSSFSLLYGVSKDIPSRESGLISRGQPMSLLDQRVMKWPYRCSPVLTWLCQTKCGGPSSWQKRYVNDRTYPTLSSFLAFRPRYRPPEADQRAGQSFPHLQSMILSTYIIAGLKINVKNM